MPDPTQRPTSGFPAEVLRRLRDLERFESAADPYGLSNMRDLGAVAIIDALLDLTAEVRQLRAALEPSSSTIVHGDEAVRAYRDLQEQR